MKRLITLLAASLLGIAGYPQVNATTIVGAEDPVYPPGLNFSKGQFIAQQFAITGDLDIDAVTFTFSGGDSFDGTLWLADAIGASSDISNVIQSEGFTVPTSGDVVIPFDANIGLGVYYLVLSTTQDLPDNNYATFGGTKIEDLGLVGLGYFSSSQNTSLPTASQFSELDNLEFLVDGTFTGTHDPVLARQLLTPASVPDLASTSSLFMTSFAFLILARRLKAAQ